MLVPSGGAAAPAARPGDRLDLGARLLGDEHRARVVLRCAASHAAFFLLPEEAWLSGALTVRPRYDQSKTEIEFRAGDAAGRPLIK